MTPFFKDICHIDLIFYVHLCVSMQVIKFLCSNGSRICPGGGSFGPPEKCVIWASEYNRVATFLADMKIPCVFPCVFPVLQKFSLCFFIEELTVIVIKEMSLAPSYTIYFLLKPYTASLKNSWIINRFLLPCVYLYYKH